MRRTYTIEEQKQQKRDRLYQWTPEKEILAHTWIENMQTQKERTMIQGAIFNCILGENIGSEYNKKRPVLIISNNRLNKSANTITVIVLSTKLKFKTTGKGTKIPCYKSHHFLRQENYDFLREDSVVKAEYMMNVSRVRLSDFLGKISEKDLNSIKKCVNWVLNG